MQVGCLGSRISKCWSRGRSLAYDSLGMGQPSDSTETRVRCPNCGLALANPQTEACPQCGGPLTDLVDSPDSDNISIKATFQQYKCDRCARVFVLDSTGRCPGCGAEEMPAGAPDANALARATRWRSHIQNVAQIAKGANPLGLRFTTRGPRRAVDEYREWLQSQFFGDCIGHFNRAKELLNITDWPAADADGDASLEGLTVAISGLADFVTEAQQTPPPVMLLATHRASARAAAAIVQSLSLFCDVIVAPHLEAAVSVRNRAQDQLDGATAQSHAISRHIELLERIAAQPGWFAWADAFDPGRATAELVAYQPSSIGDVATLVRTTFANVPEVVALPDELAFGLGPAALTSILWDSLRLERRIRAVLRILAKASAINPAWMSDPAPVAESLLQGHRQLSEQVGALGFLVRSGASRKAMLMGAIAVYERFAEGPLRKFGSVVRQAAEVGEGRQSTLDPHALAEDGLGSIIESLERAAPILTRDFSFMIRNAAAHYQFEVTETSITLTEPERKGKKRSEELGDDDFLEGLFDLNELLIAFETAAVAYAASGAAPTLKDELTRIASGPDEQYEILGAIAGLKGWVELTFARISKTLVIEGRYLGGDDTDPFVELLPTIAGAVGVMATVDIVMVILRGTDRSCEYPRALIIGGKSNPMIAPAMAGRAQANVLRQTGSVPRVEAEAKLMLVGPLAVLTHAIANNRASTSEVRDFCKWIVAWLASEPVDTSLAPDRDIIVRHLHQLDEASGMSIVAARKKDRWLANAAGDAMQRQVLALVEIQQRLRALYP